MENTEKKKYIYLDSAATASNSLIEDNYANPNSIHEAGRDSFAVLEEAREAMAKFIGAKRPSEIIFTSGATESNNLAIFGIARATKGKVAVCSIEHESALMPALECDAYKLPVDKNGIVKLDLQEGTTLVIVQHSNTEIGTIQNIKAIAEEAHAIGAYVHSDMVGSLCRIPINVQELGVDSASFSGHKIGAPKGIGCLYLKSDTPCKPLFYGSNQEHGLRAGTQNVALAKAMADSLVLDENDYVSFKNKIIDNLNIGRPTIDNSLALPNILHLVFQSMTSESLILHYGKYGIMVSGGPACDSGSKDPSHVLQAIKAPSNEIEGALRLSFGPQTTMEDIDAFIEATKELKTHG